VKTEIEFGLNETDVPTREGMTEQGSLETEIDGTANNYSAIYR
jgi:hypothetical protein